jgi:predicted transcriptional regulator
MTETARDILDRLNSWPQEDIDELAEMARAIEARRTGHYDVTPDEEAAIREGLAELDRGEWIDEQAMRAFWQRCGVL